MIGLRIRSISGILVATGPGPIASRAASRCVLALSILAFVIPTARAATGPLEPYRRFATTPSASRLVSAARSAMERYWSADTVTAARDSTLDWPGAPVPIYLSLRDGHETRACVGSPAPRGATLEATVEALAVESLRADRRHPALKRSELALVQIVIAFTDEGTVVEDPMLVDPGREGLLISSPRGHVAFLPGEARTVHWALAEARRAGVIDLRMEDTTFRRIEVVTIAEHTRRVPDPDPDDGESVKAHP